MVLVLMAYLPPPCGHTLSLCQALASLWEFFHSSLSKASCLTWFDFFILPLPLAAAQLRLLQRLFLLLNPLVCRREQAYKKCLTWKMLCREQPTYPDRLSLLG